MKICVLVKEVPDAAVEKRIDPSTGRLNRSTNLLATIPSTPRCQSPQ